MFQLHPQLKKDTIFIKDLELCQVLLMNNAFYPWFILVPRKDNLVEIIDLNQQERALLMEEIAFVSHILKTNLKPEKLNVANLGNMVSQLHIHIIARFKNDLTFPNPVWGSQVKKYDQDQLKKMIDLFLINCG